MLCVAYTLSRYGPSSVLTGGTQQLLILGELNETLAHANHVKKIIYSNFRIVSAAQPKANSSVFDKTFEETWSS